MATMRFETYLQGSEWRWRLKGGNNEIVASGEGYHNKADCLHAIALVKNSASAPVEEVANSLFGSIPPKL